MATQTNQLDDALLWVYPEQQQVALYMALHETSVVANQFVWLIPFGQRALALQNLQHLFEMLDFGGLVLYAFQVFLELTCDFQGIYRSTMPRLEIPSCPYQGSRGHPSAWPLA